MRYTEAEIAKIIIETVYKVTHIPIKTEEISLLDTQLDINPADFLYIFDILEKRFGFEVGDILKSSNYDVMYIPNLSKAIMQLCQ